MTKTNTLGVVVSDEPPGWNVQSAGFALGAKSVNPDTKLLYTVIGPGAYADAAGGKRVTQAVISGGADVVFGQGDGSSFGMIQAVETAKPPAGANKVWFIDVIGDKQRAGRRRANAADGARRRVREGDSPRGERRPPPRPAVRAHALR